VDLDLAIEGDAIAAGHVLARRLGGAAVEHERFGTATLHAGSLVMDLAATRRELYERPGALPTVERAPLAEDLARRDFTVNAMAIGLSSEDFGKLHDPHAGQRDVEARLIRVLHAASFLEDPTRLLRALCYEARLGFALASETERLARQAAAAGAPSTVSGTRIRAELEDLLAEPEAPIAVGRLAELGLDRALHPALDGRADLVASAQLGAAETGASPVLSALAALCVGAPDDAARDRESRIGAPDGTDTARADLERWIESLGLAAAKRDAVLRASARAPALARELRLPLRPSELHDLLRVEPPEALALALALGAPAEPVLRYARQLRPATLEITGADLLAEGAPESPAIGMALRETLRRKLDGELSGREDELRVALLLAREAG